MSLSGGVRERETLGFKSILYGELVLGGREGRDQKKDKEAQRLVTAVLSAILKQARCNGSSMRQQSGTSRGSAAYSLGTSAMEESGLWWKMPQGQQVLSGLSIANVKRSS